MFLARKLRVLAEAGGLQQECIVLRTWLGRAGQANPFSPLRDSLCNQDYLTKAWPQVRADAGRSQHECMMLRAELERAREAVSRAQEEREAEGARLQRDQVLQIARNQVGQCSLTYSHRVIRVMRNVKDSGHGDMRLGGVFQSQVLNPLICH